MCCYVTQGAPGFPGPQGMIGLKGSAGIQGDMGEFGPLGEPGQRVRITSLMHDCVVLKIYYSKSSSFLLRHLRLF